MNKKAALSLGITTIVYLVIAMIIIGSGISFVRMVFDMGEDTLGNAMPADDIGLNPTSDNRFVMGSNSVTVTRGETTTIQAAVYNTASTEKDFKISIEDGGCVPPIEDAESITLTSPSATVAPGESTGFRGILETSDQLEAKTYICSITASEENSGASSEDSDGASSEDLETIDKQIDITVTT